MPKSRGRRTRKPLTNDRRRQRRQRVQSSPGRRPEATLRPGQNIEHLLTDADREAMKAEMEAAERGDAAAAWDHHMAGLVVEESLHRHRLREIADLGDDAPGWLYSRWCLDQAFRWMLLTEDPRTDEMVRLVLATAHADHLDSIVDRPLALKEYGTLVASCDWLVEQLCLYDGEGLRDFLDLRAQPALLARADHVAEWADAPLGAYRLEGMHGSVLSVRDLVHATDVDVLNLGAFSHGGDSHPVLGRLVPISTPPYRMFETCPVPVDRLTGDEVASALRHDEDWGWLAAVSRAREDGRLERGFSCHGTTLFSTDLVPEGRPPASGPGELPGRMIELLESGLDEHVANGVMVAEVALIGAQVDREAAAAVGPHLTAVLVDSRILAAVRTHCTAPEQEAAWRTLAASTPSPTRDRCQALADQCRGQAA